MLAGRPQDKGWASLDATKRNPAAAGGEAPGPLRYLPSEFPWIEVNYIINHSQIEVYI